MATTSSFLHFEVLPLGFGFNYCSSAKQYPPEDFATTLFISVLQTRRLSNLPEILQLAGHADTEEVEAKEVRGGGEPKLP